MYSCLGVQGCGVGLENGSLLTLKTEGVGTSHLKLTSVRSLGNSMLKPHILKHHIPEHTIYSCSIVGTG